MFIPGITKRSSTNLEKRKGGGGGGRGGGGRGGGGRGGGGRSGGSKGSSGGSRSRPISTSSGFQFGGKSRSASAYGGGGGTPFAIAAGLPFAGRLVGGGQRNQVFGTRTYGSGYGSAHTTRGVAGRGFPFYFWPVVWGGGALVLTGTYLDSRIEYGDVNNSTRPGGALSTATFQAVSLNNTFRIVADNATIVSLISDLSQNCSSRFTTNPAPTSTPLNSSASVPRPEQVIQYYRASSIALTLDQYNNTATYAPEGTVDSPLPSGLDTTLLTCLNETIGLAAPLIDGEMATWAPSYFSLISVVWALWALLRFS
ncbi:hypothetical protein D9756_006783 [Leucocoprinus leucothites]|uniref:Uncharacterized protein n=1 Tax=Leucocoprinus leucothites TaxID=201217 RepID=A0A8H5G200_9AGAR|nr:hypothetical protein D9756_006783 [Leucoagaricus leucothites]